MDEDELDELAGLDEDELDELAGLDELVEFAGFEDMLDDELAEDNELEVLAELLDCSADEELVVLVELLKASEEVLVELLLSVCEPLV